MKYLYTENHEIFFKETKDHSNKWKYILCSWIGKTNIGKMAILPREIYNFNAIPIKVLEIDRNRTNSSKMCMEQQKTQNFQTYPDKKNKAGGISLSVFK